MKKFFATLILAAMVLSTGCGSSNENSASPAEQKPAASVNTSPANSPDAKFSIGGISPDMSLDDAKKILGEPTSAHDDDDVTFANGLLVETDGLLNGKIESVKIRQAGVSTGAGVAVGMTEQDLANAYGKPDSTENDDGKIEHKYFSGDRRIKLEFDVVNGVITEINCSLDD